MTGMKMGLPCVSWMTTIEFRKKNRGLDLGGDYLALERLYDAAESTKMELSNRVSSSISLPFITADHSGPKHMDVTLTRSQYEAIVDPVLRRLQDPCLRVLQQANLTPKELQVGKGTCSNRCLEDFEQRRAHGFVIFVGQHHLVIVSYDCVLSPMCLGRCRAVGCFDHGGQRAPCLRASVREQGDAAR